MLTPHALAELSNSLREQRVLSIYLDGRATDPATRLAWRTVLARNLAALRVQASEATHDERSELDRCLALLEQQLAQVDGALSAPGFVAFVTGDRVALAESLPVAMPNVARWLRGPWISPYIRAQKELRPLILAVVDARMARTYRYALGVLSPLERFHAHVQPDEPSHMGGPPRSSFHTGTRGASATEAGDRARQHGTQQMLHELIDHLVDAANADEWMAIGGMPAQAGLVLAMLPPQLRVRAVVASGMSPVTAASALRRVACEQARRLRQRLDRDIVETTIAHAAEHGRGAVGEDAARALLSLKGVHTLLLSTRFMNDRPDAAEELARAAVTGGTTIEVVSPPAADRLDRVGGVAAMLRYVVSATAAEAVTGRVGETMFSE